MSSLAMPVAQRPAAGPRRIMQPVVDMADPAPYANERRVVDAESGPDASG